MGVKLQDLSYLQEGKTIARWGGMWQGSPAALKEKKAIEDLPQPLFVSAGKRRRYSLIFTLSLLIFPFVILLPLLPTIIIIHNIDNSTPDYDFSYLVITPSLALSYIIVFAASYGDSYTLPAAMGHKAGQVSYLQHVLCA